MLIATGSEVGIALQAQVSLAELGVPVRVTSMPSSTVFDRRPARYREQFITPERLAESVLQCLARALAR